MVITPLLTTLLWLASASASSAQQSLVTNRLTLPPVTQKPLSSANPDVTLPRLLSQGTQVSLNGRTFAAAWSQWQLDASAGKVRTGISDAAVTQLLGVELLNTSDVAKQPVQWFSQPTTTPFVLASGLRGGYRYLDMTDFAQRAGWQLSVNGNTLLITSASATVQAIRQGRQPWGDRIVVDLDRPTPWQVREESRGALEQGSRGESGPPLGIGGRGELLSRGEKGRLLSAGHLPHKEWAIAIDAASQPALMQRFNPSLSDQRSVPPCPSAPLSPLSPKGAPIPPCPPLPPIPRGGPESPLHSVETTPNLTTIRLSLPSGLSPLVSTLPNPNRIVIDIRPDAMVERDILWASGLRWRQQFVNLGASRFPVVWLEINPAVGLTIKPIASEPTTLVGIAPLLKTAQRYSAAAAINGGFFNRNNKLPLGAIRRDGRWLSSPILNRGAIAWNDAGFVKIDRLSLQETLITSTGQRLPLFAFNSGYVQAGIARYSDTWGPTYTPAIDNEMIVVVQNNSVTAQLPGGAAGKTAFPIPPNGYLLALRGRDAVALNLPVGTLISSESATQPANFARYPHILGAGPLLLQNRQIVLDAKAEGFSDAFIRETAARSAIGTTEQGTLLIAAVHNRAGGTGPTLAEIAKIMQQLGCVDALNLDGGSSTSLYLGGQLLNRSPRTAARVHNGLGIFLQPRP